MFTLTKEEKLAIIFLACVALSGTLIDFLSRRFYFDKDLVRLSQNLGKVNINAADRPLLLEVPGVGEKTVEGILKYREENGAFRDLEELRGIKGINNYRFKKIKDFFTLN